MEPCTSRMLSSANPAFWNWPSTLEVTTKQSRPKRSIQSRRMAKAVVGDGLPVEVGAVAVEAPAEGRVALEMGRVGGLDEGEPEPLVHRVGVPEPLVAAEVGEPRVDPHPGPGGDDQRLRVPDRLSGLSEMFRLYSMVASTVNMQAEQRYEGYVQDIATLDQSRLQHPHHFLRLNPHQEPPSSRR